MSDRNRSTTDATFVKNRAAEAAKAPHLPTTADVGHEEKGDYVKKLFIAMIVNGALVLGLAAASIPARAQDQDAQSQSTGARQMPSPDDVVQRLGEKLTLSDDQKAQIKPIIADRQQKMQALRSDTSLRRGQKGRQMKSILEDSDKKINAILTPDQQKQYAELQQQMKERRQARRQNKNGGDSTNQ